MTWHENVNIRYTFIEISTVIRRTWNWIVRIVATHDRLRCSSVNNMHWYFESLCIYFSTALSTHILPHTDTCSIWWLLILIALFAPKNIVFVFAGGLVGSWGIAGSHWHGVDGSVFADVMEAALLSTHSKMRYVLSSNSSQQKSSGSGCKKQAYRADVTSSWLQKQST